MRTIYLDYNATTPLDGGVREAMVRLLEDDAYGNPSSVHHVGRKARAFLDDCRDQVASLLKAKPSEIIFTSGGTESNNLALCGTARLLKPRGNHIITSSTEHHAVLHTCQYLERREGFQVTYLPVDSTGRVDPAAVEKAMRPETILVSVMAANNEVGTLQPIQEIGSACARRGVVFHTDAVQWMGKEPVGAIQTFHADLVSICAHKFHGPKGAGVLYIKSPLHPDPILLGGGHENERRAGTENVLAIAGMTHALSQFVPKPVFVRETLSPLARNLREGLANIPGVSLRGPTEEGAGLANTVAVTVSGCDSIGMLAALDLEGICASSGSACSVGSLEPSHVLMAMGVPRVEANSLLRFSLGRETTAADIQTVLDVLPGVIRRIRG